MIERPSNSFKRLRFFDPPIAIRMSKLDRKLVSSALVFVGYITALLVVFGVLTGVLVKKLGSEVNIITVLFYRFLFSLPILFLFAICVRGWHFN